LKLNKEETSKVPGIQARDPSEAYDGSVQYSPGGDVNMKVLLVYPYCPKESLAFDDFPNVVEPLALEYVSAGVNDLCEVELLDLRIERRLKETISAFQPDIIGITGYTIHVPVIKDIVEEIKSSSSAIIVVGGHHATVAHDAFIPMKPHMIVVGEGVFTFRNIVSSFKEGRSLSSYANMCVESVADTLVVKEREPCQLTQFPLPDRSISRKYRNEYRIWFKPFTSIRTSSGCSFRCKFCSLWRKYNGYSGRSPESIVEEIESTETDIVTFDDDESVLEPERMSRLADLLLEKGIRKKYFMLARSDSVIKNQDLFRKWRKVGLEWVFVGMESATDDGLRELRKGTTIKRNLSAVEFLRSLGIQIFTSFIVNQSFKPDDFRQLRKFVKQAKLTMLSRYAILTPMPGTELHEEVNGRIIDRQLEHYDLLHSVLPTEMPVKEFYREFYRLYRIRPTIGEVIDVVKKNSLWGVLRTWGPYNRYVRSLKKAYLKELVA
jgi:radical SAM superfamily enzyme YgiQ (UPF0313 family)